MANKNYILANNLLIQLNDSDYEKGLATEMIDRIDGTGGLKSGFIDKQTKQAYIQFNKPLRLKNGMTTLCERYNLSKTDTVRLNVPRPAPDSLLDMMFASSGYDGDRLLKVWGKEMSPEALAKRYSKKCANALVTAKMNKTIVESSTADMVEKGLVGMGNTLGQVAQSKVVLRKATAQEEMDARPLCVKPLELTFRSADADMERKNICQKFIQFEIDSESFNGETLRDFAAGIKAKDLIAINPTVTNNNRYLVYCTRMNDMYFNLKNGSKTLAKKLRIKPESVHMVPAIRNTKYPDRVFDLLDPSLPMEDQIHMALGQYANYKMIEAHMNTAMTQNKNRRMVKKVVEEGAMKAVADGTLSIGQLKSAQAYEAELKNAQEVEKNKSKDMPVGKKWSFVCHKTGKKHVIECYGSIWSTEDDIAPSSPFDTIETEDEIEVLGIKEAPVKKKHYFFYSPAGYGKTLMLSEAFSERCNVTTVNDLNNFVGARPDAQFIVIDEYGPHKRLSMEDLKALTSGNPKNSFAGNRKSHGSSFVPRNDVQVVILSNYHLFYCMGKGAERKISPTDASALRDRFHIIKMDEGVDGACGEEEDAMKFVKFEPEGLSREDVTRRLKNDVAALVEEFGQHRDNVVDLFERVTKRIKWYGLTTRADLLDALPREVCGGLRTADVADVLLLPDTINMKTADRSKNARKLSDLEEGNVRKRKSEDDETSKWSKRPRTDVYMEMLHATGMTGEERKAMVDRCAPQLRLMLREEIESGRLVPDSTSPYERMVHLLKHRIDPDIASMVMGDTVFVCLVMMALGGVCQ